jgi:hypothetical protein
MADPASSPVRQGCTAIVTTEERLEQLRRPWLRDTAFGLALLALVSVLG